MAKKLILAANRRFVYFLYNFAVQLAGFFLKIAALFSPKLRLFVDGRKHTFSYLNEQRSQNDRVIWVHTASLGEFEQGLPVIQQLRAVYPSHKILVSFFSPSGYEVKKNTGAADLMCYLPLDTKYKAERFLELVKPEIAIFIKYEIWPNYFRAIGKRSIPLLLVSAIFRKDQIFFKAYGGFMRRSLKKVSHFFVQDEDSKELLNTLGFTNVTYSGDTRFDRVSEILRRDNELSFMRSFKGDQLCVVAGSTWPEDEEILVDFINNSEYNIKYVLAPHDVKLEHIKKLKEGLHKKTLLYSEIEANSSSGFEVLIIDTIGLLTRIYSYADIAYVGGGFATGLHNTLEPAVFGIPVIIGPQFEGFKEAEDLVGLKGVLVVKDREEFWHLAKRLLENPVARTETGQINTRYIAKNTGASVQIMDHIRTLL